MLPMSRPFLFGGHNSLELAKYWISYGIMCHMALSGLKGIIMSLLLKGIKPSFCVAFYRQN